MRTSSQVSAYALVPVQAALGGLMTVVVVVVPVQAALQDLVVSEVESAQFCVAVYGWRCIYPNLYWNFSREQGF